MSLSLLETILRNPAESIDRVISYYPIIENKDKNGKVYIYFITYTVYEIPPSTRDLIED